MSGTAAGCLAEDIATDPDHWHDRDLAMQMIDAASGSARTYLVSTLGRGLEGEDRFIVERFKAMLEGDIRPIHAEA